MTIKVIGAGFGRTGTLSMKFALEMLGFEKCYHMMEVGQKIYNQNPDQASTSSQGPGDDVIETDFSAEK